MESSVIDIPDEEFDRVHNVNARGTLHITSEVARVMVDQEERFLESRSGRRSIGRGCIVNISSLNGVLPVPNHVQYGSSKYASVGITETAGKRTLWD
jgi:NAD(P)-dependent dehydrogenase (short-subunit alcohol dehydrogenase family)